MAEVSLIIEESKKDKKVETNELDRNAMGGTELMKYGLHDRLPKELLEQFQIIPSRVRDLDPDRIPVLWNHDLPGDPETEHLKDVKAEDYKFKKVVYVSHWQLQQFINFLGVPYSKSIVLQNAIEPIPEHKKPDDVINICYHTTPHRGLELLIPVFKHLIDNQIKKLKLGRPVHLHVYSSFDIYGWPERNKPYTELFDECRNHDDITYHQTLTNQAMKKELEKMHIFAYPSIWQETSCIALIEAMSAGLLCVHSAYAALPETSANWTLSYPMSENHQLHCNMFADQLLSALTMLDKQHVTERLEMQKRYTNGFYNWDVRSLQWKALLEGLLRGHD